MIEGMSRVLPRAMQVASDTYGGTKTIIGKEALVVIESLTPSSVTLKITGSFYETARDDSYAVSMSRGHRNEQGELDNDGWSYDDKKGTWKQELSYDTLVVRSSTALRLFGLD